MEKKEFKSWKFLKYSAESSASAYAIMRNDGWRICEKLHEDDCNIHYILVRDIPSEQSSTGLASDETDKMPKSLAEKKAEGGTVFMQTFEVVDTEKPQEGILDWAKRILGSEKELRFQDDSLRLYWRGEYLCLTLKLSGTYFTFELGGDDYTPLELVILRALLTYFESHKSEALPF